MKKPKCIATFDCHNRNNQTWECNKLTNCISQHLEKDSKVIDVKNLAKFCKKIAKQKDCPPEFIEIVNKEFWNLI